MREGRKGRDGGRRGERRRIEGKWLPVKPDRAEPFCDAE